MPLGKRARQAGKRRSWEQKIEVFLRGVVSRDVLLSVGDGHVRHQYHHHNSADNDDSINDHNDSFSKTCLATAGEARAPQLQDPQQPSGGAHHGGLELPHRDVAGGCWDLRPIRRAGTRLLRLSASRLLETGWDALFGGSKSLGTALSRICGNVSRERGGSFPRNSSLPAIFSPCLTSNMRLW